MKIEKVNENQIRCTLSKEDLEDRQIKLSELAYGTEKAKNLFHDMIQQANDEFGFQTDDSPVMVEAIPLPGDHIILQITKVEYLEEPESDEDEDEEAESNAFPNVSGNGTVVFEFVNLETLERLSRVLSHYYSGTNSVYKDLHKNRYYLFLHKSHHTPEEFNRVCNMISEYGVQKKYTPAAEGYMKEHGKVILKDQALQTISSL